MIRPRGATTLLLALGMLLPGTPILRAQATDSTIAAGTLHAAGGRVRATLQWGRIVVRPSDATDIRYRLSAENPDGVPPQPEGPIRYRLQADSAAVALRIGPDELTAVRSVLLELWLPRSTRALRLDMERGGEIIVEGFAGDLDILTHNGSAALRGLAGPTMVEARNGAIAASFVATGDGMPITLLARNGGLDLDLPGPGGQLEVETRSGTITSTIQLERTELEGAVRSEQYRPRRGTADTGHPGPRVRLMTLSGDVTIRHR
jgi:hypothetical protein